MDQTMVGEKSMFSITPYLNRTANLAPTSPVQSENDEAAAEAAEVTIDQAEMINALQVKEGQETVLASETSPSALPKTKDKMKPVEKKTTGTIEKKVLGESKEGVNAKKPTAQKSRKINTLERVTEEDVNENKSVNVESTRAASSIQLGRGKSDLAKPMKVPTTIAEYVEPKKKKRKLHGAGKTLFDEEDGEATKRPAKVTLGPPRLLGRGGLAGPKGALKGGLGPASTGFGTFSPLKKDRRGVGASFLA
jgi:DNA-binding cell septation regulator SpoVG